MNGVLLSLLLLLLSMVRLNAAAGDTITIQIGYNQYFLNNYQIWNPYETTQYFPGAQAVLINLIPDDVREIIDSSINVLNASLANTNIRNPGTGQVPFFKLVGIFQVPDNGDTTNYSNISNQWRDTTDGVFRYADTMRNLFRADFSALLVPPNMTPCIRNIAPRYALTFQGAQYWTNLAHEVGHVLGAGLPGDSRGLANTRYGRTPDAGTVRAKNALWHTLSNNVGPQWIYFANGTLLTHNFVDSGTGVENWRCTLLVDGGQSSINYHRKCHQEIRYWSTTDTSVYWQGIRISSASLGGTGNDAAIIAGNLVGSSQLRNTLDSQGISSTHINSSTHGVISANSVVLLGDGVTIDEGAAISIVIGNAASVPKGRMGELVISQAGDTNVDGIDMVVSPNPFNPTTCISYRISENEKYAKQKVFVKLVVVDIAGKYVTTLVNDYKSAGSHTVVWSADKMLGHTASAGIYFASLRVGNEVITKKLLLIK